MHRPTGEPRPHPPPDLRRLHAAPARTAGRLRLRDGQHGQGGAGRPRFAGGRNRAGRQVFRAEGAEGHGPRPGAVAVARDGGGTGPARPGLRENADDGRYLVFPSQFNRDYEDAPEPKGKAVAITFDGPVQSLYSTLAVRLGHSGLFTTGRAEMWRNAAMFTAKAGGKCGLYLHEFAEARGRLILFFPTDTPAPETRFHFEEFVLAHARRRALEGTVELVRFFVCSGLWRPGAGQLCEAAPGEGEDGVQVSLRRDGVTGRAERSGFISSRRSRRWRNPPTGSGTSMRSSCRRKARRARRDFQEWAGGERVTLAIVFTDVVGSTALGEKIRDEVMNEVRRAHFAQSRRLIEQFQGREIKTIGDSFMVGLQGCMTPRSTTRGPCTNRPAIREIKSAPAFTSALCTWKSETCLGGR